MRVVVDALALWCGAGSVVVVVAAALVGRLRLGVGVALDLLLAASLLRLSGDVSWERITSVAAVVAVRRLLVVDLRAARDLMTSGR